MSLLALAAATGCDPAPTYGPQVPPYVGTTYGEDSVVATGMAQDLALFHDEYFQQYHVVLSLPAGAYMDGGPAE